MMHLPSNLLFRGWLALLTTTGSYLGNKEISNVNQFKGALSGLRQFLATENPLKMMKNAFYFALKALFVLKIFKFLS